MFEYEVMFISEEWDHMDYYVYRIQWSGEFIMIIKFNGNGTT